MRNWHLVTIVWAVSCGVAVEDRGVRSPSGKGDGETVDGRLADGSRAPAARDPNGDAKGSIDLSWVRAARSGSVLLLAFDTGRTLNLLRPDATGSEGFSVEIDIDDGRHLSFDLRTAQGSLTPGSRAVGWADLGYEEAPTYASDQFEVRLDLAALDVSPQRSLTVDFRGSDQLDAPLRVAPSASAAPQVARSARRASGTRLRVASLNTSVNGLSDPSRAEALGRLLRAADADVYCLQEATVDDQTIRAALPTGPWHLHRARDTVIASRSPLSALKDHMILSWSPRVSMALIDWGIGYTAARIAPGTDDSAVFACVHLRSRGDLESVQDKVRIQQARAVAKTIAGARQGDELVVVAGDWNLVGSRTPLTTIEGEGLAALSLPHLVDDAHYTWRGELGADYAPGRLDLIVIDQEHGGGGFVLDTDELAANALTELGVRRDDSAASDHLLVVADLR